MIEAKKPWVCTYGFYNDLEYHILGEFCSKRYENMFLKAVENFFCGFLYYKRSGCYEKKRD